MSRSAKASKPRRSGRRWLWLAPLLVLGVPVLLVALLIGFLETGLGKRTLAGLIEDLASAPGQQLAIGELSGSLFSDLRISSVTLSDEEGVWLELDSVTLDWRITELLKGRLAVSRLSAQRLAMQRTPPASDAVEEQSSEGPLLPELPLDVTVDELAVERIELGAPLLGEAAALSLDASLALESDLAKLQLATKRLDAAAEGFVSADMVWDPAADELKLSLQAHDAPGGVLSGLLAKPDLPAVDLDLDGKGTLASWRGNLRLALGGEDSLSAKIALDGEEPQSVELDGRVMPSGLALIEQFAGTDLLSDWAPSGLDLKLAAGRQGQTVTLRSLALASSVFSLDAEGQVDTDSGGLSGSASLSLIDSGPLLALVPDLELDGLTLDLRAEGTVEAPVLSVDAGLHGVGYEPVHFAGADLSVQAKPRGAAALERDGYDLEVSLKTESPSLDGPDLPAWIWGDTAIQAALQLGPNAETVTIEKLAVTGTNLNIDWEGSFSALSLAADGRLALSGRLPELADYPGAVLDVELDADLRSDDVSEAIETTLAGHVKGSGNLPAEAVDLLRGGVDFAGGIALDSDGAVKLSAASITGEGVAIDVDGKFADLADMDLMVRLHAGDLAALTAPFGIEAAGSIDLDGNVKSGDDGLEASAEVDGKGLAYAGERFGALTGSLQLSGYPDTPRGKLSLSAPETSYGPLAVDAQITPLDAGGFNLDPLSVALGQTLQLSGSLQAAEEGLPINGQLSGSVQGSSLLTELSGLELEGKGSIELKLNGTNGQQSAAVNLQLGPGRLAGVAHGGLRVEATGQDLLGTPTLEAKVNGSGIRTAGVALNQITATASGSLDKLAVKLSLNGALSDQPDDPLRLAVAGVIDAAGAAPTIALQSLDGEALSFDFRMLKPTKLTLGDGLALDATTLQIAGAQITMELSDKGGVRKLRADVDNFDLDVLRAFLPDLEATGVLNAKVALTDQGGGASGTIEVSGQNLLLREDGLAVAPELDLSAKAELGRGQLATSARVAGDFGRDLVAQASFPFRLSLANFDASVPSDGKLSGQVDWDGDLGRVDDFLPLSNQVLGGQLTLNMTVTGTLSSPQVAGTLSIADGRYENLVTGTLLENLTLQVSGSGSRLVVQEARASDGRGGSLEMNGAVDLARLAPNASLTLKDFAVLQKDDLLAVFDASLEIKKNGGRSVLSGIVTSKEVRIDIAAELPADVQTLDVVVVRDGEPVNPQKNNGEDEVPKVPFVLGLDLKIDLPNKVYVHGSGLDSEWHGELYVTGTTSKPVVKGQLAPRRGEFDALGRAFVLDDSTITFDGGPKIDPILAIKATADAGDVQAIVEVTGRASDPKITFTSNPILPEDEVVSRVLFNRGTGKLSALEAVQLAEALAVFSGAKKSNVGIVDRLRNRLGLDVLRFEGGGEDEEIGVVTLGEYIGKDIFVGVSQGTTPGSTSAKVEYDVTNDIVIEGTAGEQSSVGIKWQWRY